MTAELRWILLGLSLVLLAGIWWWGARRSRQAAGNAELRDIKPIIEPQRREEPARREEPQRSEMLAGDGDGDHERVGGEWVSPLEPLSIRTGEYECVPVLDGPMMVNADSLRMPAAATAPLVLGEISSRVPTLMPEPNERGAAAAPQVPNSSERQKIVTLRVCAAGETRWPGAALLAALELHGLAYGRYQVFHRRHVDGRSLFCVAGLVEPGTFDVARMAAEEFRGVTLFAVLPGH